MNLNMKNNKGITMIALVLTIVVSIILVGITINEFDDDDEIIEKSLSTKDQDEISRVIEKAKLEIMEHNVEMLEQSKDRSLTSEQMKEMLEGKSYVKEVDGYYIVTKSGHKIPMTDIYDNISDIPEDYFVKWAEDINEIFDINGKDENAEGYDETKLHIGDFVNYDAGDWTTEEINAIKTGAKGSEVVANNKELLPSSIFQFGGFGVGTDRDSRNENATPNSQRTNYVKDSNGKEVNGWRVFDVADDGSITLISAGCPEDYYIDRISNGGYVSEYILTGNINENATNLKLNTNYTKRDWNVYVNEKQGAIEATVLTKEKLDDWYSKYMEIVDANTSTSTTYKTVYGTKYETVVDCYTWQWLGSADSVYALRAYGGSFTTSVSSTYGYALGLRILITLDSSAKLSAERAGTKTIIDPRKSSNSWTYNVWKLKGY